MGDGVKLKYGDLEPLQTELKNIIEEFEHAGSRSNDLESAVGSPYGERSRVEQLAHRVHQRGQQHP